MAMSNASCTTCKQPSMTDTCTVDAVIAKSPTAHAVLNEFGIDTCCGGSKSIGAAAAHARVDASAVIGALEVAQRNEGASLLRTLPQIKSCSCGCR